MKPGTVRIYNAAEGTNEQVASILPANKTERIDAALTAIDMHCQATDQIISIVHADDTQSDFVASVKKRPRI